jgi:hypothetical protein
MKSCSADSSVGLEQQQSTTTTGMGRSKHIGKMMNCLFFGRLLALSVAAFELSWTPTI